MNLVTSSQKTEHFELAAAGGKLPYPAVSSDAAVLADIYNDDVNIAVWRRRLSEQIITEAEYVVSREIGLSLVVSPQNALPTICKAMNAEASSSLANDAADLVEMFCALFGLTQAGLRLVSLQAAMCPKFHFDRIPCRLITTYVGVATEWIAYESMTNAGLNNASDVNTWISQQKPRRELIQQLARGDVALLKGAGWEGNEQAGLVHRSPSVPDDESRLLLTLDFVS